MADKKILLFAGSKFLKRKIYKMMASLNTGIAIEFFKNKYQETAMINEDDRRLASFELLSKASWQL